MATVSSLGAGSGLDLSSLLSNLMAAEQQPLLLLQKREASYQARISAFGSLQGGLSALQTAASALVPAAGTSASDKFTTYRTSFADTTLATATATAGAGASTYNLSNIVLAKAEQIRKTGFTLPTATDGSENGSLAIKIGTGTAVNVDVKGGSTLADVRDAINKSTAGVTASIINNGSADYLTITAKDTGQANQITITSSIPAWSSFDYTPPGASTANYINNSWSEQQEAKSASVDINGLTVTSNSNTISSSISGVTVNLLKESTSGTSLTVSKDLSGSLTTALTAFIKAYNDANSTMNGLGAYNATTKVAGPLQGNSTLRTAQSQIRGQLFDATAGGTSAYQHLSNIGVTLAKDGTLSLDTTKLNAAINTDYTAVSNLVSSAGTSFKSTLEGLLGSSGAIAAATNGTNRLITANTKQQERLSQRLVSIEARYRKEFTALDSLVGSMKNTSTYLTQQLANLPGVTSK